MRPCLTCRTAQRKTKIKYIIKIKWFHANQNIYQKLYKFLSYILFCVFTRGGVEDTRLEAKAKAKDTKKIRGQGQGQPFRGQTLSRPRTGMLEAKAKDQGHKAQVLSKKKKKKKKKKVFKKIFQAISKKKKKGLHKNFSSDLHEKTLSKKFFNRSTKF